ncbi:MAG: hypothetical protein ACM359_21465 [Bacillota bacterium]
MAVLLEFADPLEALDFAKYGGILHVEVVDAFYGEGPMYTLANRLDSARLSIRDQAEYLQQLLDQFDIPYDACCCLQFAVEDLRMVAQRVHFLAAQLPKELRAPSAKGVVPPQEEE